MEMIRPSMGKVPGALPSRTFRSLGCIRERRAAPLSIDQSQILLPSLQPNLVHLQSIMDHRYVTPLPDPSRRGDGWLSIRGSLATIGCPNLRPKHFLQRSPRPASEN
jgi:hypothetical protein